MLGLWLAACASPPPVADLVLRNGRLLTMDDARPVAQALAARGGRIVAVGSNADVAPYVGASTRTIDLRGQLAIPGFIEAHGHFVGLGESRLGLELTGTTSWPQIVQAVAAAVRRAGPGQWITGRGWHQDKWTAVPVHHLIEVERLTGVHRSLLRPDLYAEPDQKINL